MASDPPVHELSRPSTSGQHPVAPINGIKRSYHHLEESRYEDPRYVLTVLKTAPSSLSALHSHMSLPSNDTDAYYYPSNGFDLDDELPHPPFRGNWGMKMYNEAKWVRRGKVTPWGPSMEDWEVREPVSTFDLSLMGPLVRRPRKKAYKATPFHRGGTRWPNNPSTPTLTFTTPHGPLPSSQHTTLFVHFVRYGQGYNTLLPFPRVRRTGGLHEHTH